MNQILDVPLVELHPHADNPRRGNLPALVESLTRLGQYRPIVVNRGTLTGRPSEILAGHHTVLAARELGWASVKVTHVDVDDDTARRILLADNRTGDLAGYDDTELADLLAKLPDLDGTGYASHDLEDLLLVLNGRPRDLQDLLDEVGEPLDDDTDVTLKIRVNAATAAAWKARVDGGDEGALFAELLAG